MKLADYWPSETNILQCIKPEAESDWDEVFLAIHQPMRLVRKAFTAGAANDGESVTEGDFLREFLKPDLPTGTLLMPILGNSGIGKSHLVRWLDVQLKRQPDADRRHVIRIPKSSSLKTVLHHILEDLHGPQYDDIRRQLKSAREQLDSIGAEERILGEIRAAIRRRYNDAAENRKNARAKRAEVNSIDEDWYNHGDPQRLPALLSDPVTSQLFMAGMAQRPGIISQIAHHLTKDASEERPLRRNFEEADLIAPEGIDTSEASQQVQRYLQILDRQNGQERKTVVRLLNGIIDGALQPLASPTDTTLSEIFLQIRKQLLVEGRELVLLVEDFAVLSGIQGALLDAMIREGVRGGVDACIMRTALAVTAGYDFGRYDTVKTRAVYGWYIDETPHDEEDDQILVRICDYVGAYLNAARFGADQLKQLRGDYLDEQWPPRFGEDTDLPDLDQQQLDAFGKSQAGWPLFPFNTAAIRQLSELYLRDANNQLKLNARTIINLLLIRILRDCRSAWGEKRFPPEGLLISSSAQLLSATLEADVRNVESSRSVIPRYLTLLRFWGNSPESLAETILPQEVYQAFGLPPLRHAATPVHTKTADKLGQSGLPQTVAEDSILAAKLPTSPRSDDSPPEVRQAARKTEAAAPTQIPEEIRRWNQTLNAWNTQSALLSKDANELRKLIAELVLGAIDWDSRLLKRMPAAEMAGWHGNFFLPNAKGTNNITSETAMCVVCTNEEFGDSESRSNTILALLALIRHKHYQKWNYPEAEVDYARLQNLQDRLVPQATDWLLARKYRGFSGDPVPALVENVLLTARFLNVESASSSDLSSLVKALFTPAPELPGPPPGNAWAELKCEAATHHRLLQEELLARIAVRQGGADATHGIDGVTLLAAIRSFKARWTCINTLPEYSGNSHVNAAVTFARRFPERLAAQMRQRQQKLASIRELCQMHLGEQFDKTTVIAALKSFVKEAQLLGLMTNDLPAPAELNNLIEEFRLARISETLKKLASIEDADRGVQLSHLTQIDDSVLHVTEQFINTMLQALNSIERRVTAELAAGEGLLKTSTNQIEQTLQTIVDRLKTIEGTAT